jgi:hypothetical protein
MSDDVTTPSDALRVGIFIGLITICVHVAGSAVFFGIVGGPLAILFSPLLSIFGWFFIVPEFIGVSLQWLTYDAAKGPRNFWAVMLVSVVVASVFMGLLGPKEQGIEDYWAMAYVAAATTSAITSLLAIRTAKKLLSKRANRLTEQPARVAADVDHET